MDLSVSSQGSLWAFLHSFAQACLPESGLYISPYRLTRTNLWHLGRGLISSSFFLLHEGCRDVPAELLSPSGVLCSHRPEHMVLYYVLRGHFVKLLGGQVHGFGEGTLPRYGLQSLLNHQSYMELLDSRRDKFHKQIRERVTNN